MFEEYNIKCLMTLEMILRLVKSFNPFKTCFSVSKEKCIKLNLIKLNPVGMILKKSSIIRYSLSLEFKVTELDLK